MPSSKLTEEVVVPSSFVFIEILGFQVAVTVLLALSATVNWTPPPWAAVLLVNDPVLITGEYSWILFALPLSSIPLSASF